MTTHAYDFNPLEVRYFYNFYTYDEELYDNHFPLEWATHHMPGTGPKDCGNCAAHGSWRGVFIGYCLNCAEYVYGFQRGLGFYGNVETSFHYDCPSAMNTYLKSVDFNVVGDIEMYPGHLVDPHGQPLVSAHVKAMLDTILQERWDHCTGG